MADDLLPPRPDGRGVHFLTRNRDSSPGATGTANANQWAHVFNWEDRSTFVDVQFVDGNTYLLGELSGYDRSAILVMTDDYGWFGWTRQIDNMNRGECCLEAVDDGVVVIGQTAASDSPAGYAVVATKFDFWGAPLCLWSRVYEAPLGDRLIV